MHEPARRGRLDQLLSLVGLPDEMSFVAAASLGCRFATSFRAVVAQGRARAGEWVAVHGCGGVGLAAVMIANALGAQVVAVDIRQSALELARALGAVHLVQAVKADVPALIRDATGGGAHLSLDALGSLETCRNSILSLRKRGRHVQVGLMVGGEKEPAVPMHRVIAWELELLGSHGMQAHQYGLLLEMIRAGKLEPGKLVGKRIALGDCLAELPRMGQFDPLGVTVIDRF